MFKAAEALSGKFLENAMYPSQFPPEIPTQLIRGLSENFSTAFAYTSVQEFSSPLVVSMSRSYQAFSSGERS